MDELNKLYKICGNKWFKVAQALGVSHPYLSRVLHSKQPLTDGFHWKIMRALSDHGSTDADLIAILGTVVSECVVAGGNQQETEQALDRAVARIKGVFFVVPDSFRTAPMQEEA